jgi:chitin synthase
MIIGSGNDRPTPRIVLDILGVDPNVDPESHAYQSLGDGNQQLNYGKVYSGLYELNGHVVPYIVVVKVGKPSERGRPGNRGKRDSQLVLMRFLMRVHFNQAMSPLELEIFHHMKNIIGVDPSFYEYVFMVDADTQVQEDSLNHLVSQMTRDAKIAGNCGETSIANDRKSFTSMIQVYEYFISHHMAKAFESLFGSVTCLPGCFCMYRVRTPYKNIPVLIAPGLVADYSENTVDTLHLKNLLHLGEDRYLTTLTMKHFPNMKTTFCPEAACQTYAPDQWPVLLSQRRRWINSTVHNLFELLRLGELCGFCCFSMRFIVFIDLLATFIQPASLVYVLYLIYLAATENLKNVPVISLVLIVAVYGFQVIIFLLKTQWQHIGWMVFVIDF